MSFSPDREDNNWWQNGGQKSTSSTEREEKSWLVGGPISMHDPFPSPSLRFRPTTESPVISSVARSIKLFRACCTRAAGACAFQRGAAAGAPPRPHQHLSSVYFPMISPPFHQPSLPLFLFSFLRFVFPRPTSPSPRGLLHTVYRQQGGEIETQQLPFRKRMFRATIIIRSSTFFVMRVCFSVRFVARAWNQVWK